MPPTQPTISSIRLAGLTAPVMTLVMAPVVVWTGTAQASPLPPFMAVRMEGAGGVGPAGPMGFSFLFAAIGFAVIGVLVAVALWRRSHRDGHPGSSHDDHHGSHHGSHHHGAGHGTTVRVAPIVASVASISKPSPARPQAAASVERLCLEHPARAAVLLRQWMRTR